MIHKELTLLTEYRRREHEMSENILMRIKGSMLLSNSWKQELTITERGVNGDVIRDGKRQKMFLPFDRIAQVNLTKKVFAADLELVNAGGTGNLEINGLKKKQAEESKTLIEDHMKIATASPRTVASSASVADEIAKLANLRDSGAITEEEFQTQKRKLLDM